MPEGLEAEIYRRSAATCVGRTIESVFVDDLQDEAVAIGHTLPGLTIVDARAHGKLVMVDLAEDISTSVVTTPDVTLGLHFGMTGRLIVDGHAPIEQLEYASGRDDPKWNRLVIRFDDGGAMRVNDPRRWARFTIEPDTDRLGPDFRFIEREQVGAVLAGRRRALKSTLLDQSLIAGFGNLCVDEILWWARLRPGRAAGSVTVAEVDKLVAAMREHLPEMLDRGGSHTGTIDPGLRATGGLCPDGGCVGVRLARTTVGGRTTIWCPNHQR